MMLSFLFKIFLLWTFSALESNRIVRATANSDAMGETLFPSILVLFRDSSSSNLDILIVEVHIDLASDEEMDTVQEEPIPCKTYEETNCSYVDPPHVWPPRGVLNRKSLVQTASESDIKFFLQTT
jgi:hypothetical protein